MAYYLVRAKLKEDLKEELEEKLQRKDFVDLRPFGKSVTFGLENARMRSDGSVAWEEEDYCNPPLAQERKAVLDRYFDNLEVEEVEKGEGWDVVEELPPLFPSLERRSDGEEKG